MTLVYGSKHKVEANPSRYKSFVDGGNVTYLHHQSVLVMYFPREVRVHPHPTPLYQVPLCHGTYKVSTNCFSVERCSIIFANSMPKMKLMLPSNDYGYFINDPLKN